jgi:hypothetical protein
VRHERRQYALRVDREKTADKIKMTRDGENSLKNGMCLTRTAFKKGLGTIWESFGNRLGSGWADLGTNGNCLEIDWDNLGIARLLLTLRLLFNCHESTQRTQKPRMKHGRNTESIHV